MTNLETILLALLVGDALALGGLVLLQQGKGADVGAAFGSGGSNTMFGSAGSASFLTKLTVWLAIGFFLISFGLAYTAKERAGSINDLGIPELVEEPAVTEPKLNADVPLEEALERLTDPEQAVDTGDALPEAAPVDEDIPEF